MFVKSTHTPKRVVSLNERLAESLEHLSRTEGQWFDGTLGSIESRKNTIYTALSMARQAASTREIADRTLAAMEIEQSLQRMYAAVDHVSKNFVSDEIVESQRELPHFSINVMDY